MKSYSEKIRSFRDTKEIPQIDAAKAIGVTRPTYAAIENGKRQVTIDELRSLCILFGISMEQFLFSSSDTKPYEGKMNKFKQIILNLMCSDVDGGSVRLTKSKLAGLVYLNDHIWAKKSNSTMSGLSYRHVGSGAIVDAYYRMIDELYDEGAIMIELSGRAILLTPNEPAAPRSLLDDQELEHIRAIVQRWKDATTQDVTDYVKNETPWKFFTQGEIIPDNI